MRVFVTKWFARFMRVHSLEQLKLLEAIAEVQKGLTDADYGGGVLKKRVAREGEGKSGGYRTIIIYKIGTRAFFVYGFQKSSKDNLRVDELKQYKKLSSVYLQLTEAELKKLISLGELTEISNGKDTYI